VPVRNGLIEVPFPNMKSVLIEKAVVFRGRFDRHAVPGAFDRAQLRLRDVLH
jgi:hypothetical protein